MYEKIDISKGVDYDQTAKLYRLIVIYTLRIGQQRLEYAAVKHFVLKNTVTVTRINWGFIIDSYKLINTINLYQKPLIVSIL